jgi:hypothetical protein
MPPAKGNKQPDEEQRNTQKGDQAYAAVVTKDHRRCGSQQKQVKDGGQGQPNCLSGFAAALQASKKSPEGLGLKVSQRPLQEPPEPAGAGSLGQPLGQTVEQALPQHAAGRQQRPDSKEAAAQGQQEARFAAQENTIDNQLGHDGESQRQDSQKEGNQKHDRRQRRPQPPASPGRLLALQTTGWMEKQ